MQGAFFFSFFSPPPFPLVRFHYIFPISTSSTRMRAPQSRTFYQYRAVHRRGNLVHPLFEPTLFRAEERGGTFLFGSGSTRSWSMSFGSEFPRVLPRRHFSVTFAPFPRSRSILAVVKVTDDIPSRRWSLTVLGRKEWKFVHHTQRDVLGKCGIIPHHREH